MKIAITFVINICCCCCCYYYLINRIVGIHLGRESRYLDNCQVLAKILPFLSNPIPIRLLNCSRLQGGSF